jgi:hypothetical protein
MTKNAAPATAARHLAARIAGLVATFHAEHGDSERGAYDWVLELAEPAVDPRFTSAEWALIQRIQAVCEQAAGREMWPADYDAILDAF